MTLDNLLVRGRNNLDFMRLAAATLVIVSHAYPIARGVHFERAHEPLMRLTGGQHTMGELAVAVFFIISGFLITASWERARSPLAYLWARALRIYPALIVVVLLSALVLGPLVTTYSPRDYFTSPELGRYISVLALWDVNLFLPGVFASNPSEGYVNASLWTLFYEFACYLLILGLGWARVLRRDVVLLLLAVALLTQLLIESGAWLWFPDSRAWRAVWTDAHFRSMAVFAAYFLGGSTAYLYRRHIRLMRWGFVLAIAAVVAAYWSGLGIPYVFAIAGTYVVLYLGALPSPFNSWGSWGDFSYGTYIYAWPVQQAIVHAYGGAMPVWANAAIAVPLAWMFGGLSWHLLERHALALARGVTATSRPGKSSGQRRPGLRAQRHKARFR